MKSITAVIALTLVSPFVVAMEKAPQIAITGYLAKLPHELLSEIQKRVGASERLHKEVCNKVLPPFAEIKVAFGPKKFGIFSANGSKLLTYVSPEYGLIVSAWHEVEIWRNDGKLLTKLACKVHARNRSATFSDDGRRVVMEQRRGKTEVVFDAETGEFKTSVDSTRGQANNVEDLSQKVFDQGPGVLMQDNNRHWNFFDRHSGKPLFDHPFSCDESTASSWNPKNQTWIFTYKHKDAEIRSRDNAALLHVLTKTAGASGVVWSANYDMFLLLDTSASLWIINSDPITKLSDDQYHYLKTVADLMDAKDDASFENFLARLSADSRIDDDQHLGTWEQQVFSSFAPTQQIILSNRTKRFSMRTQAGN